MLEEEIIGAISEAEREAAARKAQAELQAAQIVAEGEKRATEIAKRSAAALRSLREETLQAAEARASAEYAAALRSSRESAAKFADSALGRAEGAVEEIVGRVMKK